MRSLELTLINPIAVREDMTSGWDRRRCLPGAASSEVGKVN
jgi:hypothetical protein